MKNKVDTLGERGAYDHKHIKEIALQTVKDKGVRITLNSSTEAHTTSKKAAQKLTNFRAYLHKSSVAACFADIIEITDEGLITESGLYPSNLYKKHPGGHRSSRGLSGMRIAPGLKRGSGGLSREVGVRGVGGGNEGKAVLEGAPVTLRGGSRGSPQRPRKRPTTASDIKSPSIATFPSSPLTARATLPSGDRKCGGAVVAVTRLSVGLGETVTSVNDSPSVMGVQRTQW
ncbi:unnamed protein product, partial [Choristocarpus tenellus]